MRRIDTQTIGLPGQQTHDGAFPLAIGPTTQGVTLDETLAWARAEGQRLVQLAKDHGALLLRGFPVAGADDFDALIRVFELDSFTYEESFSNAIRINKTDLVFTANEAPPEVSIFLHHEMAQTPLYPAQLFFCCEIAPEANGETPLCRSDVLLRELEAAAPDFVRACERLGVRYSNAMPNEDDPASGQGRSWRSTLGVTSRGDAETRLKELGYDFEWRSDESLQATTPVLPAIRRLKDGRRVFFNQLIAAFRGWQDARNEAKKSIRFGDESEIPADAMQMAIDLADKLSFDVAWQAGDVALVDNYLVMHGRRPFKGARRVLVSLVADDGSRLAA